MPNYFVFIVRNYFFKNMKRKKDLIEKLQSDDEAKDHNNKRSMFFKISTIKILNEDSLSFSSSSILLNDNEGLIPNGISFIDNNCIDNSLSNISFNKNMLDLIGKKILTVIKIPEGIFSRVSLKNLLTKKDFNLRNDENNLDKKSIISQDFKNPNPLKIILNSIKSNENRFKNIENNRKLSIIVKNQEKSITPHVRIHQIPSNTPVDNTSTGFLSSRIIVNTPSSILRQNLATINNSAVSRLNLLSSNPKINPKLKINSDTDINSNMFNKCITINKFISTTTTPRKNNIFEVKKFPQKNKIAVTHIQSNYNSIIPAHNYNSNSIKTPSVFNINLNLNLNLNLNVNSNVIRASPKKFNEKNNQNKPVCVRSIPNTLIVNEIKKLNRISPVKERITCKINEESIDKIKNMPLTDRHNSSKFVFNDKSFKNSLTYRKNLHDNDLNTKNNIKTKLNVKVSIPKSNANYNKISLQKSKPINLIIDLNNYTSKEQVHSKINTSKAVNKPPLFKGLKINNFEKIYELKQIIKKIPNSTSRKSKEKVPNLILK